MDDLDMGDHSEGVTGALDMGDHSEGVTGMETPDMGDHSEGDTVVVMVAMVVMVATAVVMEDMEMEDYCVPDWLLVEQLWQEG